MSTPFWEETPQEFADQFTETTEQHPLDLFPLRKISRAVPRASEGDTTTAERVTRTADSDLLRAMQMRIHNEWLILCNSSLSNDQIRLLRFLLEKAEIEAKRLHASLEPIEPTLVRCPYCRQLHESHLVESCPIKPRAR